MEADMSQKMFNDDWVQAHGFIEKNELTAQHLISSRINDELITVDQNSPLENAVSKITELNISQIPVTNNGDIVGMINESNVFTKLLSNPDIKKEPVKKFMLEPCPVVDSSASINQISSLINNGNSAVLVKLESGKHYIITKHDIIQTLSN